MRYNLGTFSPRPGSSDYAYMLESEASVVPITRALEEMLKVRLSRSTSGSRADLLKTLDPEHPDRAWVDAVHGRMHQLRAGGLELRLLACDMEDGDGDFVTIAATAPDLRLEVLPNDWMQVGFATTRGSNRLVRTWPRLFREVCDNGSLVCVGQLEPYDGAIGIDDAIERFLAIDFYQPALQAFRESHAIAVPDPREYLDEFMRLTPEGRHEIRRLRFRELLEAHYQEIEARFEEEGDPSLYGLINAITATARDTEDWRERLDLEELGGQLAVLRPPVPRRSPGAALVPA